MLKKDVDIGFNLKKHREKAALSQERAAAQLQLRGLNMSREILSQMERGKYNIPPSVLLAMAKLYNVPIQDFFTDVELYEPDDP